MWEIRIIAQYEDYKNKRSVGHKAAFNLQRYILSWSEVLAAVSDTLQGLFYQFLVYKQL